MCNLSSSSKVLYICFKSLLYLHISERNCKQRQTAGEIVLGSIHIIANYNACVQDIALCHERDGDSLNTCVQEEIEVKKDTERADEIRAMKKAWEDAEPGRAAKVVMKI